MSQRDHTANSPRRPEILDVPWTPGAKQSALEQEVLGHYVEYFDRAMKTRNWSPWHDFSLTETEQLGPKLTPDTVSLIEGFLAIEEYVADYVLAGLELFTKDRTRRRMQLQWGAEEARHGTAWELVLKSSGVRTDAEIEAFLAEVQQQKWTPQQHAGLDTPLGSATYAMVQERATYFNYQETRMRIRVEYGLPILPTQEEQARGSEVGASEAFRMVGQDEIAHHGLFLKIVQSYMRYFPSLAFETLNKVFLGFEMPALRFIPNGRSYLRAVLRTKIYSANIHREKVYEPILRSLGLAGHAAFKKATESSADLPTDREPSCISLSKTGEWTIQPGPEVA